MKIATITCHDVYNYGASLQAYALQSYCESLGCEYSIIDYKPDYLSGHYSLSAICNKKYNRFLIRDLYRLAKLPARLKGLKRKRRFDDFTSRFLNLTDEKYNSFSQLCDSPLKADLYIAGSDQIWNTFFKNGRDGAFYLDFVKYNSRKISYAASFATTRIFNNAEEFVKKKLRNFDAISVRETSALKLLENLGYKDAYLVCDPVFLLNRNQWLEIANRDNNSTQEYIFVYDCERSPLVREIALNLKRMTGLPIHAVSDTFGRYADKDYSLSGPLEFLSLISKSRYVVANSFHALAFSLIFQKDFFIVNRSEAINTRMHDFLSYLELSDRLISSKKEINTGKINFDMRENKLSLLIENSQNYLKQQISLIF